MNDHLVGLRVEVIIDEDGAPNPPDLPPGTITQKLSGGGPMYVVHLDKPVEYNRPALSMPGGLIPRDWVLSDLSVQARHKGHPLDLLLTKDDFVVVNIVNHSTGDCFAIGAIKRYSE